MNIIEQIEIKNFRSIGNRKKESYKVIKCQDLNIISGANDSGKSNILRALNLFFNKKTDLVNFFNFEKDFFKKQLDDENEIKEEVVTIKIWFRNPKNKDKNKSLNGKIYLPEKFWISRKWKKSSEFSQFDQLSSVEKDFEYEKAEEYKDFLEDDKNLKSNVRASLQKQLTDFINSIQYHYIPAIKDSNYFSHLYGELQHTLWKTKASNVEKKKIDFEKAIQKETDFLMTEFKNSISKETDIQPLFELPADLIDLFRALVVQTGNVDLKLRGDGYQAKLIPEILNFISVKELSFTSNSIKSEYKSKKYFIWGFEEPENSYEYKNAQLLANKFKDVFCKNAQIFISTHSFNFLGLRSENINFYRVWKDELTKSSKISKLKIDNSGKLRFENIHTSEWEILQEELGFFYLNEELQNIYLEKQKQLVQILEMQKNISKPIIYSEGHNFKYLEKAKSFFYNELELEIKDCGGKTELQKICKLFSKTNFNKCKVIFVFDCDAASEFKDCMNYKTNFVIPYLLKKNSNNNIPELQKGIENMFNDDTINEIEEAAIFDVTEITRNGKLLSRNRNLRKIEFEKIINEQRNKIEDYVNFEDLYLKIKEL